MTEKLALITGASRGLGAAIATELAPDYHVIAVARTTGALEELDDRIKAKSGQATLAPMDITNADAMAHLCRSIYDRWGKIDLWVHTAIHAAPLMLTSTLDMKDFGKSVDLNVTATATLITYVAPLLGDAGQAVFFDDVHTGEKFFGAYGATKAAQMSLVNSWAAETANTGPMVRVLNPSPMPTAVRARFYPGENRDELADPMAEAARLLATLNL